MEEGWAKERDSNARRKKLSNEVEGKGVRRKSYRGSCRILIQSLPHDNLHTALHGFPSKLNLSDYCHYSVSISKKSRSQNQLRLSVVEDRSTRSDNSVVV